MEQKKCWVSSGPQLQDLRAYAGDFLGFGQAEVGRFFEEFSTSESPWLGCTCGMEPYKPVAIYDYMDMYISETHTYIHMYMYYV